MIGSGKGKEKGSKMKNYDEAKKILAELRNARALIDGKYIWKRKRNLFLILNLIFFSRRRENAFLTAKNISDGSWLNLYAGREGKMK